MHRTIIFFTQAYLHLVPKRTWEELARAARLVLVIPEADGPHPAIGPFMQQVLHVPAVVEPHCPPVLDLDRAEAAVRDAVADAHCESHSVSVFCQGEFNLLNAARLRERLGVAGDRPELVHRFRDKLAMKAALADAGIALPKFERFSRERAKADPADYHAELASRLGSPMVLKPTGSAGSYGVSIVRTVNEFEAAAFAVLQEPLAVEYEADEFIRGDMYQCDSLVSGGEVAFAGMARLSGGNFEFVQGKPLAMLPVAQAEEARRIQAFNRAVLKRLGFAAGCTHLEFFVREGECIFLEVAARIPGAIGVPFHERNSGLNLIEEYLRAIAGLAPVMHPSDAISAANHVLAWLPTGTGRVLGLQEPTTLRSEFQIDWKITVGQQVDCRSLGDCAGMLTFRNANYADLRSDFDALAGYRATSTAP